MPKVTQLLRDAAEIQIQIYTIYTFPCFHPKIVIKIVTIGKKKFKYPVTKYVEKLFTHRTNTTG